LARKRKKNRIFEHVSVEDIGSEGKSIARVEGQVIFITKALPGDVVDVRITKKKKSYLEGIPIHFHEYSDRRIEPFCSHFDICGGCKWQDLPYNDQIAYKRKQVVDNLERIGKVSPGKVQPILPSEYTRFYRNKMEYTFSAFRWLTKEEIDSDDDLETRGVGFHIPGRWDKVVDIEKCYLQKDPSNEVRNAIRDYALEHDLSFFDLRRQEGFLRNLIIRTSTTNEVMVIVIFFYEDEEKRKALLDYLASEFDEITSLMYMINSKANDAIYDLEPVLYKGRDFIYEQMENLWFKLGPKSFYQTNSEQAYELYKIVRNYADLHSGEEIVYDLYTGTGTIANFLAPSALKVVGIESVPEAVEDAKKNAAMNRLDNTQFFAGDMKDKLSDTFFSENGTPDVIITDPPRAGMHKKVVENILAAAPWRIVYVSCNPATQARDIELLKTKYTVEEIQPVDMFPHTYHVENVALLVFNQ